MKRIFAAALLLVLPSLGIAQTAMPYVWPQTVGTTQAQVLPNNPARKQVFVQNPNTTALVAICPAVSRKDGTNVTCAVNGAGSITLYPGDTILIAGIGGNPSLPSAWNAIASAPSSALTILEFE